MEEKVKFKDEKRKEKPEIIYWYDGDREKEERGGGLNVCIQQYGTEFKIAIVIIVIQNSEPV